MWPANLLPIAFVISGSLFLYQQPAGLPCSDVLSKVRALEAQYLDEIDGREFHVARRWKLDTPADAPDQVASAQPRTTDYWVCFRLRDKKILIRERPSRLKGNQRVILVNDLYSARVLRLAEGGYLLERHTATPQWEGWYPDFYSIGIHGSRAADPVLAILSPIIAGGPPVAAMLKGEHGFSCRCVLTSEGLVHLQVSSSAEHQPWYARSDRQWEVVLDPSRHFACVRSKATDTWRSFHGEVRREVIERAPTSLLPAKYVVEELVRSVAGKSPSVVHHLLIEYTIGPPTPCQHPPEAFYLPYYGIDESVIRPSGTLRVAVLAAASAAAALLALLALLALRRAWNRPNSSV